ncbi:MAG: hypothetical protein IKF52_05525 [Clostridia bacterium]|nr:hypothetical protein [Clostridia bacterium]
MSNLVSMERISLKNNPNINEKMIQEFIFKNPTSLQLGDLTPIVREKIQPSGGRLDLLLGDDNNRYEVEIQLGATDPSHIIRTIEYWDTERKRYPQYDHCAVIVAEDITARFMNVISLFNGNIPLIAIQISAYKNGSDVSLVFTKVIDRITLGVEDDDINEVTDRNYWENRSTSKMMKNVDEIFKDLGELVEGYELKYNKFYVGLSKDGYVRNFISFQPKKSFIYVTFKGNEDNEKIRRIEESGIEFSYESRWRQYKIRINNIEEYRKYRDLIYNLAKDSMEYFNND